MKLVVRKVWENAVRPAVAVVMAAAAVLAVVPASAESVGDGDNHWAGSSGDPAGDVSEVADSGASARLLGHDVSGYQGDVDWPAARRKGAKFVYIKATESTTYVSSYYKGQWAGSARVGILRGAYHFARPNKSSGIVQANYFLAHGGVWRRDGKTLPPMLDLEDGCYGLSHAAMVKWIRDFSNRVHAKVGRYPALYTTTSWWKACTGNSPAFGKNNALFLARWASTPGSLPAGWHSWTLWQFSDHGSLPGDQDYFNGDLAKLKAFARG